MGCLPTYKGKRYNSLEEIKSLIQKENIVTPEQLAIDIASKMSYSVEVKTALQGMVNTSSDLYIDEGDGLFVVLDRDGEEYGEFNSKSEAQNYIDSTNKKFVSKAPTQHYSNLTVPGGTNYTENEISTPLITPSIKGHAQFATDKGIGWFRSDDKAGTFYEEAGEIDLGGEKIKLEGGIRTTDKPDNTKTRRILEIQSDWAQKIRNNFTIKGNNYTKSKDNDNNPTYFLNGKSISKSEHEKGWNEYLDTPENSEDAFLKLLLRNDNWITFFIKATIQNAAKKGYTTIRFPKGETAAKIEGHETIAEEINKIDNEISLVDINFSKALDNYIYKYREDIKIDNINYYTNSLGYVQKDNIDGSKQTVYSTEINEIIKPELLKKLNKKKQELKSQGIEKLKPIEAFYEIKVGNILEKQFGKDNVKTITDEFGNQWREITVNPERDLSNIYLLPTPKASPQLQILIDNKIKEQRLINAKLDRLHREKREAKDKDVKLEKLKLISRLEQRLEDIEGEMVLLTREDAITYGNLRAAFDADMNKIKWIFDNKKYMSFEDTIFIKNTIDVWSRLGDFTQDNPILTAEEVKLAQDGVEEYKKMYLQLTTMAAEAMLFKSKLDAVYENLLEKRYKELKGTDLDLSKMKILKDVGWLQSQVLDLGEVDNIITRALSDWNKIPSFEAAKEAKGIFNQIDDILDRINKKMSLKSLGELFKQTFSDKDNRTTGNYVHPFSQSFFEILKKISYRKKVRLRDLREEEIKGTIDTDSYKKRVKEIWRDFNKDMKDNTVVVDVRMLYPDKELYHNQDKITQEDIDKYHKLLKETLGEYNYNKYLEFSKKEVEDFKLEDELIKIDLSEDEYKQWYYNNNPYYVSELISDNHFSGYEFIDIDNNKGYFVYGSDKYLKRVPKRTISGKSTGFYDAKFEQISKDTDLLDLYEYLMKTLNELKSYLPEHKRSHLQVNFMPFIKRTLIEEFSDNKSMQDNLTSIWDYLKEAVRTDELGEIIKSDTLDVEGNEEQQLQVRFIVDNSKAIQDKKEFRSIWWKSLTKAQKLAYLTDLVNKGYLDNSLNLEDIVKSPVPTYDLLKEWEKEAINEVAQEKSWDIGKAVKAFSMMSLGYKYKSRVEDAVRISYNILSNAVEQKLNAAGDEFTNQFGDKLTRKGLNNLKAVLDYHMKIFFGYRTSKIEGQTGIKVYTKEEEEKKKELELLLEKVSNDEDKEALETQLKQLGGIATASNFGDGILKYIQLKGLGWNLPSAVANLGFGQISNFIEAADGRLFNMKQLLKANSLLLHSIGKNYTFNMAETDVAKKVRNLVNKLDVLKEIKNEIFNSTAGITTVSRFGKKFKWMTPYNMQARTEYLNQAAVMIAIMLNTKVTDADGKESNLWEAYDNEGNFKEGYNITDKLENSVKVRIDEGISILHGNYDPDKKIRAKEIWVGRALTQFRNWMFMGFNERFKAERPDERLGYATKGRYRTYWDLFVTAKNKPEDMSRWGMLFFITKNLLRKMSFGVYKTNFDEKFNEVDAANLRKNLQEIVMLMIVSSFALMLRAMKDDEDDKRSDVALLCNFWINQMTRLETDIWFYTNPSEFEKLNRNIMPAFTLVVDAEKALQSTYDVLTGNKDDILKSGPFKGESRILRDIIQVTPGATQIKKIVGNLTTDYGKGK